jgi:FkbM family methyltransferase
MVYVFEPVPEYFNLLCKESINYPNYKVYNKAVSDYIGRSSFNICGTGRSSQCSSLLEFSDKTKLEEHWKGYNNFIYTEKIEVDVTTLKQFIEENNIDHIDYLHCDVQGCDLKVLKSLGEYINIVKEGVVETARNEEVKLYKNQETYSDVEKFLKSNGFEITEVRANNRLETEFNVFFKRK